MPIRLRDAWIDVQSQAPRSAPLLPSSEPGVCPTGGATFPRQVPAGIARPAAMNYLRASSASLTWSLRERAGCQLSGLHLRLGRFAGGQSWREVWRSYQPAHVDLARAKTPCGGRHSRSRTLCTLLGGREKSVRLAKAAQGELLEVCEWPPATMICRAPHWTCGRPSLSGRPQAIRQDMRKRQRMGLSGRSQEALLCMRPRMGRPTTGVRDESSRQVRYLLPWGEAIPLR
jgi:hypothetical protein